MPVSYYLCARRNQHGMKTEHLPDTTTEHLRKKVSFVLYHAIALITVIIWGTTYVSTKVLINAGLSPVEIMLYRFVLAYVCLLLVSYRKKWADTPKDELLLFLCGLFGGSVYFLAENTALEITLASNVSLLLCTAPVFTILLSRVFYKEALRRNLLYGSLIALVGVGMVVLNGSMVLKINPVGDLLTLVAAVSWAVYCLILKRLGNLYSTLFITRKVFFYGIASLLLYQLFFPSAMNVSLLSSSVVSLNLLFLGMVASMLCYLMWNTAVRVLGASKTANYIYIGPLVTLVTSWIFLSEPLTAMTLAGAFLIIFGIYIAEKK